VNIVRNDGSPGAAPSIRIRGTVPSMMLTACSKLMVYLPVILMHKRYHPNDISSIDILKGCLFQVQLYGTRAANGVVLVTTKKVRITKAKYYSEFL